MVIAIMDSDIVGCGDGSRCHSDGDVIVML